MTAENARKYKLENRIHIVRDKLRKNSEMDKYESSLDLIVSNPPYVPNKDLANLPDEIKL